MSFDHIAACEQVAGVAVQAAIAVDLDGLFAIPDPFAARPPTEPGMQQESGSAGRPPPRCPEKRNQQRRDVAKTGDADTLWRMKNSGPSRH